MNKLYNTVENILLSYNLPNSKEFAKALVDSHVIGGRVNEHLKIGTNKYTTIVKRYFPNKPPLVKIITFILESKGLKLCKYCRSIQPINSFSVGNSSCKSCHNLQQRHYYYSNPETQVQRVRKRERNLDRSLSKIEIQEVFSKCNNKCVVCGYANEQHNIDWGTNLHIDHIIPVAKGGLTSVENSQLLCISCNTSKGAKIL